jgi:hypothetical protein
MFQSHNVFSRLGELGDLFHLTGSRFFGYHQIGSDWDFFVQDDENILHRLRELGFYSESATIYDDPLCVAILRHPDGIHIQVVSDSELKTAAQKIIKEKALITSRMMKEETRLIWKTVILAIQHMRDVDRRISQDV